MEDEISPDLPGDPPGMSEESEKASDEELLTQLKKKMSEESYSMEQKEKFNMVFTEYIDIIARSEFDLGRYNFGEHTIETEGYPVKLRSRPLAVHYRERVGDLLKKNFDQGVIRESFSPWSAPIVVAVKKNGKLRICVDYRKLNAVTKKDVYIIPRIRDILDGLGGAKYFISLDLASGYYQIPLSEGDKEKTAFTSEWGLYEFNVLPFGLCNAPSTFQRIMDKILAGLKGVFVYIDDIVIIGETFQETIDRYKEVAKRFRKANLKVNLEKSSFFKRQIEFLGHTISEEGIQPSDTKIKAVKEFPRPQSSGDVRAFYGLASFYRSFVQGFALIAAPLQKLLRKNCKFVWDDECQIAFNTLQQKLISQPILAYPNFLKEFRLYTDASNFGLGAILG